MVNTEERIEQRSAVRDKVFSMLRKIIIAIVIAAAILFALVVIYQVLEVLFILAVLIIGYIRPRSW